MIHVLVGAGASSRNVAAPSNVDSRAGPAVTRPPIGEIGPQTKSLTSEEAPQRSPTSPGLTRVLPDRIGPYKILDFLSEGGMGSVYLAEQEQPIRRMVVLKVVKLGMDTKEVIARFESERQALAMMNHPNIAQVHYQNGVRLQFHHFLYCYSKIGWENGEIVA